MMRTFRRIRCTELLILGNLLICASIFAVSAKRGKVEKDGKVIDDNAIILENEYISATITTNQFAGQIMKLVYKPTGQDLSSHTPQGYSIDRMGENRYFWKLQSEGFRGEVVKQTADKAVAAVSYIWNYDYDKVKTKIAITKTYTLRKGAAELEFQWKLKNIGDQKAMMSPWIKHLGGHDEKLLAGPTCLLQESGLFTKNNDFIKAVTDWQVRLSGTENTEKYPMVASVMEFKKIFQHFPWTGKKRYTMETVLSRISLEPGKEWTLNYALSVMANLGHPMYVCPELAASTDKEVLQKGQKNVVKVFISPAVGLGAKRLEGEVMDLEGNVVAKLPNREVNLVPGKISSVDYGFTPAKDGVYNFSLTVYDNQSIFRLGQLVSSQQSSITLPVVVGAKPAKIVKKWQSNGFSWPTRQAAKIKPWRTLVNGSKLKVGQFRVPERVFPENIIEFSKETQSAAVKLAKGEYEDLQFVVDFTDVNDVMGLSVSVSPIKNKEGQQIEDVQLREAIYLTSEIPSGYKSFPVGQWPDPLFRVGWEKEIPNAPITKKNIEVLKKSKRRVFYLIGKAPRNGKAGTYQGTITMKLKGKKAGSFPVEFAVYDFAIPKRASFRCSTNMVGFSRGKWENNLKTMGLSKEKIEKLKKEKHILDRYRELVLTYGWTPSMYFGRKEWEKYYDFGRGVSQFPTGKSKDNEKWLKEKGLLKYAFTYAPFDEHPDAEVPKVVKWAKQWKKESDIPILDCYYGKRVEPLFGLVDVWLGQSPNQKWAKERRMKGDRFIACNSPLIWYIEFIPVEGRSGFWDDFVTGYDGRYVYSTIRWTDDVYKKNWTSGNYMGCTVYPSPDGIAPSIRMETLRDGVEDYDYLAILKKLVAEKKGKAPAALIKQAESILNDEQIKNTVNTIDGLYKMKSTVADLILKLQKA